MSEYQDIKTSQNDEACHLCDKALDGGNSPWSICFDPEWKTNVWGGDTHEYRALLCQSCAGKLLLRKGVA